MIAYVFHWPPSELWPMDTAELDMWAFKAKEIQDAIRKQQEST